MDFFRLGGRVPYCDGHPYHDMGILGILIAREELRMVNKLSVTLEIAGGRVTMYTSATHSPRAANVASDSKHPRPNAKPTHQP